MEKYITKNGLFKNSDNVFLGWIFPSKKKKKNPSRTAQRSSLMCSLEASLLFIWAPLHSLIDNSIQDSVFPELSVFRIFQNWK